MSLDVVGFGALNLDKLYRVNKIAKEDDEAYIKDLSLSCGGSAANTIIGLSRLGLDAGFIGIVSNDQGGQLLLGNLKNEGVNTDGVLLVDAGRSGSVIGMVDDHGQRALYVDPGVNDSIKPEEVNELVDRGYLSGVKVLHITSFVGASIKAQETLLEDLPSQIRVSFDPGRIYAERGMQDKAIKNILEKTNMLLLNDEEIRLLTDRKRTKSLDERVKALLELGIEIIVVKQGDKGCYVTDGQESHFLEAFPVKCRDTTGAGDAFNAGFIYGILKNQPLYNSCSIGNYLAACCVEYNGATGGHPDEFMIEKFLDKKS